MPGNGSLAHGKRLHGFSSVGSVQFLPGPSFSAPRIKNAELPHAFLALAAVTAHASQSTRMTGVTLLPSPSEKPARWQGVPIAPTVQR
jgi:hypothetical protein